MKLPPFTAEQGVDSPGIPYRGRDVTAALRGALPWSIAQWCPGLAVLGCLTCVETDCLPLAAGA